MKKHRANSITHQSRLKQALFAVLAAALVITILHGLGLLRPIEIVTDQILLPVRRATSTIGQSVSRQLGTVTSIGSLAKRNAELENEVAGLKKQLANQREITHENDLLRAQLNFSSRQSLEVTPARVVGYAPDNFRRYLKIDIGKSNGIRKGMAVVSNGALVGTIDEVADFSSRVFLLSDVEFRIRAIGQAGRANGIVAGQIGSGYSMDKIAQGDEISRGETIITAGSDIIPKGIIIGTVESVESSDNAIFQVANIRPAIDLTKLEMVFVVKGQK